MGYGTESFSSTVNGQAVYSVKDVSYSRKTDIVTSIYIQEGLDHLGRYAFTMFRLELIRLPNSIQVIEDGALSSAAGVDVPKNHPIFTEIDGVTYNKQTRSLLHAARDLRGDFVVPQGILHIGNGAFRECRFSRVSLPEGLESIGYDAFAFMENLRYVNLPESLTSIDHYAFTSSYDVEVQYTQGSYAHSWFISMPDIVFPEHGMGRGD